MKRILGGVAITSALALTACIGDGDDGDDDVVVPDPPDITFSVPRAFPALTFDSPVAMLQAPDDVTRWFVVEQNGVVRVFENDDAVETSTEFVNIAARVASPDDGAGDETGLLGMAFSPDFPTDPRVYVSYTTNDGGLVSRISEFRTADEGETLDPDSETVLLSVNQPEDNHNGGHIQFGPDDMLYIGLGDGGGSGDDHGDIGNAQNLQSLLGKMLRIDVSADEGTYAIPEGNLFSGNAPCNDGGTGDEECPEIHAYGFRNPWRWSFDGEDLWVGDVGQGEWEEIDNVVAGGNYGWRCFEGAHEFNENCGPAEDPLDPVVEYSHDAGFSVTGGYVYHGSAIEDLAGRYVFGDFSGRLWHVATDTDPTAEVTAADGFDTGLAITSFAEDEDGELYIVDHESGMLHRLEEE